MIGELLKIAGQCDGVRCDMAMLVLPDVFERTWGRRAPLFWPEATRRVRERVPGLLLHGRGLLGPGMDDAAAGVRLRLRQAALRPPARGTRPAGARASSSPGSTTRTSWPASWRTTTSRGRPRPSRPACTRPRPSSRFCRRACGSSIRDSSRADGSASRRTWAARPMEPVDESAAAVLRRAARRCCGSPTVRDGQWQLLECVPGLGRQLDLGLLHRLRWQGRDGERLLIAVNYARTRASATSACRSPTSADTGAAPGSDGPGRLRSDRGESPVTQASISTCLRGATTSSRWESRPDNHAKPGRRGRRHLHPRPMAWARARPWSVPIRSIAGSSRGTAWRRSRTCSS